MNRRKLIRNAAIVVVGFFVFDRALGFALDRMYRTLRAGETVAQANLSIDSRADVLVLGSSRARHHYVATTLADRLGGTVHNAGSDGQGLPYALGLLDVLLHHFTPKLVIVEVDGQAMESVGAGEDRVSALAPYIDESDVLRRLIYDRGPLERLKYVSRTFRFNGKLIQMLSNLGNVDTTSFGYVPVDGVLGSTPPAASPVQTVQPPDPAAIELLGEIADLARSRNAEVVFVASPRWTAETWKTAALTPHFDAIQNVADSRGVPFIRINADNHPEFRDQALFADRAHLNGRGAELFSRILGIELADRGLTRAALSRPIVGEPGVRAGRSPRRPE